MRVRLTLAVACGVILWNTAWLAGMGATARADGEEQFVRECQTLAARRGMEFIAAIPGTPPFELPAGIRQPKTWNDAADTFALRWRVTWRVVNGYLLVGPQYDARRTDTLYSKAYGAENEPVGAFIAGLNADERRALEKDSKLPLRALTSVQRDLLAKAIARHRLSALPAPAEASAYIRVHYRLSLQVYSNGMLIGQTSNTNGTYETYETEAPASDAKQPVAENATKPMSLPSKRMVASEFVRALAAALWPEREIHFDHRLALENTVVSSTSKAPFAVVSRFVNEALGCELRGVGNLAFVGWAPAALPNEEIQMRNVAYITGLKQHIEPVLLTPGFSTAAPWVRMQKAWQLAPELFLSSRPRFRAEMTAQELAALKEIDGGLALVLESAPKVAVAQFFAPTLYVFYEAEGRKQVAGMASVFQPPARPVDALVGK